MKILLIDGDSLMRDGLSALLALSPDIEVIGALDGAAHLAYVHPPSEPDLVVLDIGIPDYEGTKTLSLLRARWPGARVLVLTFRRDELSVRAALRGGVDGYLLKTDTRAELANALRCIREGQPYLSPTISEHDPAGRAEGPAPDSVLSERERHVMRRIAEGHRTRDIALELSLSPKTIEKYRSNIMRKLGLKTAAAVAAYAIANGYVEI